MRKALLILCVWSALTAGVDAQRRRLSSFSGRVIAAGVPRPDVFVQLEGAHQEHLGTVLTDAKGSFRFERLSVGDYFFIVVEEEGLRPYRERLEIAFIRGGLIVIYLEPETGTQGMAPGGGADGSYLVDVRQLQVEIPEAAWDAYDNAVEESEKGRRSEAIEHLKRALELAPDFYGARIKLGGEYVELGSYRDAEAAYRSAIESNPSGAVARLNLGVLYYKEAERARVRENELEARAKLEQARDSLEGAVALNPVSPAAQLYLGAVLYRMGAYADAEQMLVWSLELDDAEDSQARLMLINVYTRLGRLDDALEQIAIFVKENPDSPQRPAIEQVRSQIEAAIDR